MNTLQHIVALGFFDQWWYMITHWHGSFVPWPR